MQDTWDLSTLYRGRHDPALRADEQAARRAAAAFAERWRGRVVGLTPAELRVALEELDALSAASRPPSTFRSLGFYAATDDEDAQADLAFAQNFDAEIQQELSFFHAELAQADLARLAACDELAPYAHWLGYQARFAPHTLSEDAERTIARKDVTGKSAWNSLYQQVTDGITFDVEGEGTGLTRAEVQALLEHRDPALRLRASEALAAGFRPHAEVCTFVFNTIFEDHRQDIRERGYTDVIDFTVFEDDLDRGTFDALLAAAAERQDLVHRYHALRKRALGLEPYRTSDAQCAAFGEEPAVTWDQARAMVVEAFTAFAPQVGRWAEDFLGRGRVDVFPRAGKASGAFCWPSFPPVEPYVLVNFTGRLDDVFTLAHELGHALHFSEALVQRPLNYWAGRAFSETASVFAELWLHEHLMAVWADDPARQAALLDRQVKDAVRTGFTQLAYVRWERRAHAEREEGVVRADRYTELWLEEMASLFGPAVALDRARDGARWMTIPHFVFARFYCYSYAFGKLLTLALHGLWRQRGDAFVTQYLGMLAAGGSRRPDELASELGFDLQASAFWRIGLDEVERHLTALEALPREGTAGVC